MKVLHVLGELRPSGAEVMLRSAAPFFCENGVHSEILATGEAKGSYAPILEAAGYRIHHIPYARSAAFFLAVARFAKRSGFDVMHLHSERAFIAYVLAARLLGYNKLVRTVHNTFQFQGFLRVRRGFERRMAERLGVRFIAISSGVEQNERRRFGISSVLIPNWFDSRHFRLPTAQERASVRTSLGIAPNEYVLITIGNCSDVKNHAAFIKALTRLTDCSWRYLHVGREEPAQPERALAKELGIDGRIEFCGPCDDVRPFLYASDLYVMPSRYEGFSIAVLEALATGMPALLSEVPGLVDIRKYVNDVFYCEPSEDGIAAALRPILEAGVGADHGGAERSARMHELLGAARGVRAYCELYAGVAGRVLPPSGESDDVEPHPSQSKAAGECR